MEFVIRMTKDQYNQVKLKAEILGYNNLSEFVRSRILKDNSGIRKQIREIHNILIKDGDEY